MAGSPFLTLYVIFDSPSDYRGEHVVRRQIIPRTGDPYYEPELFARGPTLADVRARLPLGLYNLDRFTNDDPVIVEVWI